MIEEEGIVEINPAIYDCFPLSPRHKEVLEKLCGNKTSPQKIVIKLDGQRIAEIVNKCIQRGGI